MVADVLREKYEPSGIFVRGEYIDTPAQFPTVTIVQKDDSEYMAMHTVEGEQAARVMFEVTVFSNAGAYRKLEAYNIMDTVDDVMTGKLSVDERRAGFHRTMCSPIPNLQDSTVFALVARYEGIVDKDLMIYTG